MAEVTKIEWTHHTFNPWIGCSKVHAGCANCYAEADMDKRRHFAQWGPHGTRVRTSEANWKQPLKWDREAKAAGVRHRVFCASLADVFEDWAGPIVSPRVPERRVKCDHCGTANAQVVPEHGGQRFAFNEHTGRCRAVGRDLDKAPLAEWRWATLNDCRTDLFRLIDATPHLDWLLLTKRPENIRRMWPVIRESGQMMAFDDESATAHGVERGVMTNCNIIRGNCMRRNVWVGTSISDQETANKMVPELLLHRDLAPVIFLSAEPLLGPIDFGSPDRWAACSIRGGINWVIVGGESGPDARPCNMNWITDIVRQCGDASVACFVKQMGTLVVKTLIDADDESRNMDRRIHFMDKKGGDPSEWSDDLRVREFPSAVA